MIYDIRCRSGLNLVRDSEVTCVSVPQHHTSSFLYSIAKSVSPPNLIHLLYNNQAITPLLICGFLPRVQIFIQVIRHQSAGGRSQIKITQEPPSTWSNS